MSWRGRTWAENLAISGRPKAVAWHLGDFHNEKTGQCDPLPATIARRLGCSVKRVREALSDLENMGLIGAKRRYQRATSYALHLDLAAPPRPPRKRPSEVDNGGKFTRPSEVDTGGQRSGQRGSNITLGTLEDGADAAGAPSSAQAGRVEPPRMTPSNSPASGGASEARTRTRDRSAPASAPDEHEQGAATSRARGTNARALGVSPRQLGRNPRRQRTDPRAAAAHEHEARQVDEQHVRLLAAVDQIDEAYLNERFEEMGCAERLRIELIKAALPIIQHERVKGGAPAGGAMVLTIVVYVEDQLVEDEVPGGAVVRLLYRLQQLRGVPGADENIRAMDARMQAEAAAAGVAVCNGHYPPEALPSADDMTADQLRTYLDSRLDAAAASARAAPPTTTADVRRTYERALKELEQGTSMAATLGWHDQFQQATGSPKTATALMVHVAWQAWRAGQPVDPIVTHFCTLMGGGR